MVLAEITFKSGSRKTVHCDKFDWRYSSEGGEIMEEKCTKCNGCLDCGFRGAWFCTVGTL